MLNNIGLSYTILYYSIVWPIFSNLSYILHKICLNYSLWLIWTLYRWYIQRGALVQNETRYTQNLDSFFELELGPTCCKGHILQSASIVKCKESLKTWIRKSPNLRLKIHQTRFKKSLKYRGRSEVIQDTQIYTYTNRDLDILTTTALREAMVKIRSISSRSKQ